MLTIFTTPKSFIGNIGVIQRNAILSWKQLYPACEIILFGDDEGVSQAASEYRLEHIKDIKCNELGTPFINYIFETAQEKSKYQILAYVNADIILTKDFISSIQKIKRKQFLIIGQRYDLDINYPIDFNNPEEEEKLRLCLKQKGLIHGKTGIDYFVFNKGLYEDLPPFVIGRTSWDNWLIYYARSRKAYVIDATETISIIHQNHSYSHHPGGEKGVWKGEEAVYNYKLSGGDDYLFGLDDATYILTDKGIKPCWDVRHLWRRLLRLPVLKTRFLFLKKYFFLLTRLFKRVKRFKDNVSR